MSARADLVLYDLKLLDVADPQPISALNSYASPTPVIEAGRVYVHFGSYGTACLDTANGKVLWTRRDLECDHLRGPGSSPILFEDLLILHFDGVDVQYVAALDKRSGQTVWKTGRSTEFGDIDGEQRKAYCTPSVIDVDGRKQLISPGAKAVMGYDPRTGRELWKIRYAGFSNVSRTVWGNGLAYINTGYGKPEIWAVRPNGTGDVTDSHVVWKATKSMPAKPSPVLVGKRLYMMNDSGIATCLDALDGHVVWQERLGGQYSASPLYADGRVYFFSHEGKTTVVAAEDAYRVLAENKLDDGFMASPAVVGDTIYFRTKGRLLRVEL